MHVIKARDVRRPRKTDEAELLTRATGQIQAQKLIDLIDESAPDEGVVDVHEIESRFADGSRRIPLVENGAVGAVVEGASDTTRRMSAVDVDAAVAMAIDDSSDTTRRMSAIQANELAAMITPVEVSFEDPTRVAPAIESSPLVVKFHAPAIEPRIELPLPPPVEAEAVAIDDPVVTPVRRGANLWMIGALIALAGAAAGLAAVLLA